MELAKAEFRIWKCLKANKRQPSIFLPVPRWVPIDFQRSVAGWGKAGPSNAEIAMGFWGSTFEQSQTASLRMVKGRKEHCRRQRASNYCLSLRASARSFESLPAEMMVQMALIGLD